MSTLTASPHVAEQELTEEERQQKITAYYEREIQKGLNSGPPIPVTPEFWDELNAEIEQAYHEKKRGRSVADCHLLPVRCGPRLGSNSSQP